MSRHAWKRSEREIAKLLGGKRIPVTGIDRDGADVITDAFAVQVKTGRNRPSYLKAWLSGICATAGHRTGLVVWQASRERIEDAVVVMRLKDFVAWHGSQPPEDVTT